MIPGMTIITERADLIMVNGHNKSGQSKELSV